MHQANRKDTPEVSPHYRYSDFRDRIVGCPTPGRCPMPRRPRPPCSVPGCSELTPRGGRRQKHTREANADRASRGGAVCTTRWQRIRRAYLYANPWCVLCGQLANVADHFPLSRRELIARKDPNPDAAKHLRPLCVACHNRETARNQPGGFAVEARSRREASERPPFWPGGDPLPLPRLSGREAKNSRGSLGHSCAPPSHQEIPY